MGFDMILGKKTAGMFPLFLPSRKLNSSYTHSSIK
jgi:hypothetical protein